MPRPHGTIRQSQIITTFGPGATVHLPDHGVIIGGLEHWKGDKVEIQEERLAAKLEVLLQIQGLKLFAPPVESDDPRDAGTRGITAFLFPEWFVAQYVEPGRKWRARPLIHRRALENGAFPGPDRRRHPVVPVRFLRACINGHVDDIDWPSYVHKPGDRCSRQLWLEERGTSGDLADVYIRCDCGAERSMLEAKRPGPETLGFCDGKRPWLGPRADEPCTSANGGAQLNRLLLRSASDAYFPQILRVISIPDRDQALREAVGGVWDAFGPLIESAGDLPRLRKSPAFEAAVRPFCNRRQGFQPPQE